MTQKLEFFESTTFVEELENSTVNRILQSSVVSSDNEYDYVDPITGLAHDSIDSLQRIYDNVVNGKLKVKYRFPVAMTKVGLKFGRVYPVKGASMSMLWAPLRGTLAHANYVDIDMCNCHPVLIVQYAKKHNVPTPILSYYVNNREECLSFFDDRAKGKREILRALYGGKKLNLPAELQGLQEEISAVADIACAQNPKVFEYCQRKRVPKYSCFSLAMQDIERQLLQLAYSTFETPQRLIGCFDGFMCPKDMYTPDTIAKIQKTIAENFDYTVSWVCKPMEYFTDEQLKPVQNSCQDVVNEKWINEKIFQDSVFCRSATGTGKTTSLINWLKSTGEQFIYIANRCTLLADVYKNMRAAGLSVKHYEKDADTIKPTDSIITTFESLHKLRALKPTAGVITGYHTVIMDEFQALQSQFASPYIVNYNKFIVAFINMLKNAKKFIAIDGHLCNDSVKIFKKCFNYPAVASAKTYHNIYKNKSEILKCVNSETVIFNLIEKALIEKKTFVVATDKKRTALQVKALCSKYLDDSKICCIHGGSTAAERMHLLEQKGSNTLFSALIYTPTIQAGVSLDTHHYEIQFNVFTNPSLGPIANLQMMNRVRHKRINYLHIKKAVLKKSVKTVANEFIANTGKFDIFNDFVNMIATFDEDYIENPIINAVCHNIAMETKQNFHIKKFMLDELNLAGYDISDYELTPEQVQALPESKATAKACNVEVKDNAREELLNAPFEKSDETGIDTALKSYCLETLHMPPRIQNEFIAKDKLNWKTAKADTRRKELRQAGSVLAYFAQERDNIEMSDAMDLSYKSPANKIVSSITNYAKKNCTTFTHTVVATKILSKLFDTQDLIYTEHYHTVIPKELLYSRIQSLTTDTMGMSVVQAKNLFYSRSKITTWANFKASLCFINSILNTVYGITFKATTTKRTHFKMQIVGFESDEHKQECMDFLMKPQVCPDDDDF